MTKLVVLSKAGIKVTEYQLDKNEATIGRFPSNSIQINNPGVSGHHARVVINDDICTLEDLSSRNGTYVNHKRIDKRVLQEGDQINFPNCKLVYLQSDTVSIPLFRDFSAWRDKHAQDKRERKS